MLDKNTVIAARLFVVSIAMFGFGYALVPLYDVLCDVTGINGKSGDISLAEGSSWMSTTTERSLLSLTPMLITICRGVFGLKIASCRCILAR